jgi:hypothetical protein
MIEDEHIRAAREFFENTPARMFVTIRRKQSLYRCRQFRNLIRNGNPAGYPPEAVAMFLKREQRNLLNLRRYRETGRWPTEH